MALRIPWEALFAAAWDVRKKAHAPYSHFKVGAAILSDDGRIFVGCNVENSAYGVSLCAERNAIGQAVAAGVRRLAAVAIVADSRLPCPPCGMCRQAMSEHAPPGLPVRARTLKRRELRRTLAQLLPDAFTDRFL
jgi:cytidine deaminase